MFKENLNHAFGHADASVAVWDTRKEALVHAYGGGAETHEVRHGGSGKT